MSFYDCLISLSIMFYRFMLSQMVGFPSFFKKFIYFYLFMAVLGLRFCVRAFSSCGKWGPLFFIVVRGPLLLWSTGSRRASSVVVAHGPSCSVACGIFPDQGLNPCPLHWQADSQPLRHQGSPPSFLRLNNIQFCVYTTFSLSIHLSMNIWVLSISWLL